MRSSAFFLLVPLLLLTTGCPKKTPPDPGPSDAAPPTTTRDAGSSARTTATHEDAGPGARTARTALVEGRALARKKAWTEASKAFARGLSSAPDDATLLAELTWAAFNAHDLEGAESAASHGLAVAREPLLRAQILYSAARVKEAKKDNDAARAMYTESLGLRENGEVRRRLDALGGPSSSLLPCQAPTKDVDAVCACLQKHADDLFVAGEAATCKTLPVSLSLGTPRLSVVSFGPRDGILGRTVYLLVAREMGKARTLAELGADFEPGAFGVHNASTVHGGEVRKVGGREVVVVRSTIDDNDMNMAGLEQCFDHAEVETVCSLGDAPRCVPVRVKEESGCGPGVEVDEDDEEAKALVAERKPSWSTTRTTRSWTVTPQGALEVTAQESGAKTAPDAGRSTTKNPLF